MRRVILVDLLRLLFPRSVCVLACVWCAGYCMVIMIEGWLDEIRRRLMGTVVDGWLLYLIQIIRASNQVLTKCFNKQIYIF